MNEESDTNIQHIHKEDRHKNKDTKHHCYSDIHIT